MCSLRVCGFAGLRVLFFFCYYCQTGSKTMGKHAVCFDLDDTLWDIVPAIVRAESTLAEWIEERVGEDVAAAFINQEKFDSLKNYIFEKHSDLVTACKLREVRREIIKEGLTRGRYSGNDMEDFVDEALNYYLRMRSTVDLFPSCVDVLEKLSSRHSLGVVTNGNADLNFIGINKYFSCHMAAFHPGMRPKPHFEMFHAASAALSTPLANIIMVGDSLKNDIQPALDLGMKAVFIDIKAPGTAIPPAGVLTVSHLEDLPDAVASLVDL